MKVVRNLMRTARFTFSRVDDARLLLRNGREWDVVVTQRASLKIVYCGLCRIVAAPPTLQT